MHARTHRQPLPEQGAARPVAQPDQFESASVPPRAPSRRPRAPDGAIPPGVVLNRQRQLGNRAVQRLLVSAAARAGAAPPARGVSRLLQRVKTPNLPPAIPPAEQPAAYRNYLILLQTQLKMTAVAVADEPAKTVALAEVGTMIGQVRVGAAASINRADLEALIGRVNALTPAAPSGGGSVLERLKPAEVIQFNGLIDGAKALIDAALGADAILDETFGPGGWLSWTKPRDTAKANLGLIKGHLDGWKTNQATKVEISRSDVGYGAYNQGKGAGATLTVGQDFLTAGDAVERAATLVHEASHGALGTKDHGYMGAPYFFDLKDSLALDNADHYKYAMLRANGRINAPAAASGSASDPDIDRFQRAKGLSYFTSNKIWTFLMWMLETYSGKNFVRPEALQQHAASMGFPATVTGPGDYRQLRKAHVQAMAELYTACKGYLVGDMNLTKTGTSITMTPKGGGARAIKVDDVAGKSVAEMSKKIMQALAAPMGLPTAPEWDLTTIGDAFFKHLFEANDPRYQVGDNDKKVLSILQGA